mgnify:CR=1 FL=1
MACGQLESQRAASPRSSGVKSPTTSIIPGAWHSLELVTPRDHACLEIMARWFSGTFDSLVARHRRCQGTLESLDSRRVGYQETNEPRSRRHQVPRDAKASSCIQDMGVGVDSISGLQCALVSTWQGKLACRRLGGFDSLVITQAGLGNGERLPPRRPSRPRRHQAFEYPKVAGSTHELVALAPWSQVANRP